MRISTGKDPISATSSKHARALLMVGAALASIVFAACGVTKTANVPSATQAPHPTATIPITWQTVHDDANTFTLRVPADWKVRLGGGSTYGNSKLGVSIDSVDYRYAAPQTPPNTLPSQLGCITRISSTR